MVYQPPTCAPSPLDPRPPPPFPPPAQHTRVSSKLHEDYKLTSVDVLGKPRNLGAGERNLPADHVFGVNSLGKVGRGPLVLVLGSTSSMGKEGGK